MIGNISYNNDPVANPILEYCIRSPRSHPGSVVYHLRHFLAVLEGGHRPGGGDVQICGHQYNIFFSLGLIDGQFYSQPNTPPQIPVPQNQP